MAMLEYENQAFLDIFHEDGLLVTARGLGVERVFINLVKLYCDPGNLVLVLNTTSCEEEYIIEQLEKSETKPMPRVITTEFSASARESIYMEGGVLFVTSRILVVDMLTDRVPIHLVSGILVYKAHKIIESCQEAFILRLYRQKNKTGFVKAFSDSPQSFTSGFCHVERVMKSLFVRKLFLWPRFHASVAACLDKHKVDVVEFHLHMTPAMVACQTALLDLINACVKELKRGNSSMDTDEITVENAMTKIFDTIVRLHLDPIWHQLSPKTKQLASDIKTLRLILQYLTQYDCVNFYNLVNSIRSSEKTFGQNSGWLFMDAADSLFMHARSRVYKPVDGSKKVKKDDQSNSSSAKQDPEPQLEECPKWRALADILAEIEEDCKTTTLGPSRVLVAAEDDRTCSQIKEYLCEGGQSMLQRLYGRTLALKAAAKGGKEERARGRWLNKGKGKGKGKSSEKLSIEQTLTQMIDTGKDSEGEEVIYLEDSDKDPMMVTSTDAYTGFLKSPVTILHPLHGSSDPNSLIRTLYELEPRYVVLYDADMLFVRQLEVFRASRPGKPLRVYCMMYTGSTEEQRYLTTLRREKEAFEFLIREKATMVIPEERDGRMENDPHLSRDTTPANATVNTRKGGLEKESEVQKIIVDMREFRSELPSLIHRRGIEIEPVTIEVGDYILTPDICVERKSVSDLIGSLNNGRLYNQAVSMCRHYRRPVLLVEFDPNKPFTLQGKYQMSNEISSSEVTSKLTLLTMHFPRLRILWCQSPYATAELFQELKVGRAQPDAAAAMAISGEMDSEIITAKYSHGPHAMLLKMPGINSKNVFAVMNKVTDLVELTTLSEAELGTILDNAIYAKQLWNFLHREHKDIPGETTSTKQNNQGPKKRLPLKGIKRKR